MTLPGLGSEDLILATVPQAEIAAGSPMLLIREVGPSACTLVNSQERERTLVSTRAVDPRFRILMIPLRQGQEIPRTVVDVRDGSVGLQCFEESR